MAPSWEPPDNHRMPQDPTGRISSRPRAAPEGPRAVPARACEFTRAGWWVRACCPQVCTHGSYSALPALSSAALGPQGDRRIEPAERESRRAPQRENPHAGESLGSSGAVLGCLLAFGPFRLRAWVVGQRPHGCWLGSRGWPLEGFWEAVLRPLGGRFGASWGLF